MCGPSHVLYTRQLTREPLGTISRPSAPDPEKPILPGMRNCPRCHTSIGETLSMCPACDLPDPFAPAPVEQSSPGATSLPRKHSLRFPRSWTPSTLGGWIGVLVFVAWNVGAAVFVAVNIGSDTTPHCHADRLCSTSVEFGQIVFLLFVGVIWLIGFVATGMIALLTVVNANRRRSEALGIGPGSPLARSEFEFAALDPPKPRRQLRTSTWAIIAWTVLCALWIFGIALGVIPGLPTVASGDGVDQFIGAFLVFLLWTVVLFFLGIGWLASQPDRAGGVVSAPPLKPDQQRCPHCGKIVAARRETCNYCGESMAPASARSLNM